MITLTVYLQKKNQLHKMYAHTFAFMQTHPLSVQDTISITCTYGCIKTVALNFNGSVINIVEGSVRLRCDLSGIQ